MCFATSSRRKSDGSEVDRGDGGQRALAPTLACELRLSAVTASLTGTGAEGSRHGRFRWTGPGAWFPAGGGDRPAGGRAEMEQPVVVGDVSPDSQNHRTEDP